MEMSEVFNVLKTCLIVSIEVKRFDLAPDMTTVLCTSVSKMYKCVVGGGAGNRSNPFSCVCLHGDRKPHERKANLETFKRQEAKFLICTDVAARGLDISGLPFSKYLSLLLINLSSIKEAQKLY